MSESNKVTGNTKILINLEDKEIKIKRALVILLCAGIISCNSGSSDNCDGDFAYNFDSEECESEFITKNGLSSISCEECSSDLSSDIFKLSFHAEPYNGDYITVLDFMGNINFLDPAGCNGINLQNLDGENLEPNGSIENIEIGKPDNLRFTLNQGGSEEQISCDFCWTGDRPFCDQEIDDECVSLDIITQSECISEDLLDVCGVTECTSSIGDAYLTMDNCTVIDCSTIECNRIIIMDGIETITRPGSLINITNELTGTMIIDGQSAQFNCGFFQA